MGHITCKGLKKKKNEAGLKVPLTPTQEPVQVDPGPECQTRVWLLPWRNWRPGPGRSVAGLSEDSLWRQGLSIRSAESSWTVRTGRGLTVFKDQSHGGHALAAHQHDGVVSGRHGEGLDLPVGVQDKAAPLVQQLLVVQRDAGSAGHQLQ